MPLTNPRSCDGLWPGRPCPIHDASANAAMKPEPCRKAVYWWDGEYEGEVGAEPLRVPTSQDHIDLTARPS